MRVNKIEAVFSHKEVTAITQRKNSSSDQENISEASITGGEQSILTKEEKLKVGWKLYTIKAQTDA